MKEYLSQLLSQQLAPEVWTWLSESVKSAGNKERELEIYQAYAKIPSIVGKSIINDSNETSRLKNRVLNWRTDQAARLLLLLSLPSNNIEEFKNRLRKFFEVADVNELETLCLGIPYYPFPEELIDLARLGLRSNIKSVFEAVALNNPYPFRYFDEDGWNQMILKSLFVESPLYKIIGVEERANHNLAQMLCDYAHERWAAGRVVNPELWRPVGPYIDDKIFKDIQKVLDCENSFQQQAALLACSVSDHPEAQKVLEANQELKTKIISKEITWDFLAENWYKNQN